MREMADAARDDVTIDDSDRDAARRAIERNWPDLALTDERYTRFLEGLAKFHRRFGTESFELRYNLRPPKNREEEWAQDVANGRLTHAEYCARLKADAERPIDLEMLTDFSDACLDDLKHYGEMLRLSVIRPSERSSSESRKRERAIDVHVSALREKLPLWKENIATVLEFLEELRARTGAGLAEAGDLQGTSAHWLAMLAYSRLCQGWRACKDVARRSRRDPRYIRRAEAIDLFGVHRDGLPRPQSLHEQMRYEFVLARAELRRVGAKRTGTATESVPTATHAESEDEIDSECRCMILVGEMFSLVGAAGHIFRPQTFSDWGIDGEIEFKHPDGNPSGQRIYVQLKSGDSHLRRRKDGTEIHDVKNERHLQYWTTHAYPVFLVVRQSNGLIRWMDVTTHLRQQDRPGRQIPFSSEPVTIETIRNLANKLLRDDHRDGNT